MPVTRVIVIEPERLIRSMIMNVIEECADLTALGFDSFSSVTDDDDSINIAIVSFSGPAAEATRRIDDVKSAPSPVRVLALVGEDIENQAKLAIQAGAMGCVSRGVETDELVLAVRKVAADQHFFCGHVSRELARTIRSLPSAGATNGGPPAAELTAREASVVALLAKGMSNVEIADALHLSEATIKTHLGRVMVKWGVRDRVQVLLHAVRAGVVRVG